MNARDLQIGDYVIAHDRGHLCLSGDEWQKDRIMVVSSIVSSVVGCAGKDLDGNDVIHWVSFPSSQIDPIPLSEEFMTKNFPEYEEGYEIGWWAEDKNDETKGFQVEFRNNKIELVIHNIRYVHEIQHIVRMCGLNKTIKI